jgi:hypothetical protein
MFLFGNELLHERQKFFDKCDFYINNIYIDDYMRFFNKKLLEKVSPNIVSQDIICEKLSLRNNLCDCFMCTSSSIRCVVFNNDSCGYPLGIPFVVEYINFDEHDYNKPNISSISIAHWDDDKYNFFRKTINVLNVTTVKVTSVIDDSLEDTLWNCSKMKRSSYKCIDTDELVECHVLSDDFDIVDIRIPDSNDTYISPEDILYSELLMEAKYELDMYEEVCQDG